MKMEGEAGAGRGGGGLEGGRRRGDFPTRRERGHGRPLV